MTESPTPVTVSSSWVLESRGEVESSPLSHCLLPKQSSEYTVLTDAMQEAMWLLHLLKDFTQDTTQPITVFMDNQNLIRLLQNHKLSYRTKHCGTLVTDIETV